MATEDQVAGQAKVYRSSVANVDCGPLKREEDGVSIGKCPDFISGIHGDDPVRVYADLARIVEEVVTHFEQSGRQLPPPRVRPMQEVG